MKCPKCGSAVDTVLKNDGLVYECGASTIVKPDGSTQFRDYEGGCHTFRLRIRIKQLEKELKAYKKKARHNWVLKHSERPTMIYRSVSEIAQDFYSAMEKLGAEKQGINHSEWWKEKQ